MLYMTYTQKYLLIKKMRSNDLKQLKNTIAISFSLAIK